MRDLRARALSGILFGVLLVAVRPAAPTNAAQDEPTPSDPSFPAPEATPSDPAAQRAWVRVEAARARAAEAEIKYQESQQALRAAPDSSEAKAASRQARKQRDAAQKEVRSAESEWRKRLAESRPRRGPAQPAAPAAPAPPTSTPTPVPLGNDAILPTPGVPATPAGPAAPANSALEGSYSGDWTNKTFNSGGPASAVITVDEAARTFQVVLTLGGNVFGVGAPGPQTLSGSYDASGRTIAMRSELFGNLSVTVESRGRPSRHRDRSAQRGHRAGGIRRGP